ncbi:hypothetical protein Q8A67_018222 [Cirrhinus molitorella]|uniref:Uncharacterized protein n=1 Tax=Cirrhinus molitorella TaxID=172907 RepID=A0AA88PFN6_9TELE|nr:hypothetical protein Q8A67_018222 [Cirrhinus molitorella]
MPISTRPVRRDTDTPFRTACLSDIALSTGYNLSSPFSPCLMGVCVPLSIIVRTLQDLKLACFDQGCGQ